MINEVERVETLTNKTTRWQPSRREEGGGGKDKQGKDENQVVARQLNHARQLTRGWLIFTERSRSFDTPGSSTLDLRD